MTLSCFLVDVRETVKSLRAYLEMERSFFSHWLSFLQWLKKLSNGDTWQRATTQSLVHFCISDNRGRTRGGVREGIYII